MARCLVMLALFLMTVPALAVSDRPVGRVNPEVPFPSSFRFAVFGDFRPARSDDPYPPAYRQTLNVVQQVAPLFAVSTGDAWFGYGGDLAHFRKEVDIFIASLRGLGVPLYNAVGNHDVTGKGEREAYLKSRFGNLYGSFDVGDAHFIILDSDEVGMEGTITGSQLQWLQSDLEQNRHAATRFVFLHRPLFSPKDPDLATKRSFVDRGNRDALHRLFVRYGVTAVFAGHDHLYDERVVDGVRYYVTGGGGAPLYAPPERGGFYHLLVVTVAGKQVSVEVRKLP